MTGDEGAAGRCGRFLLAVVSLCCFLLLNGCSEFNRLIGLERVGPDEFAVESRAPLTVPPDFDLRPPQPGAPRPQETTAAERARRAIDTAGPGEPGKQASGGLRAPAGGPGASQPVDPQQAAEQSLSNKLLGYNGNDTATAVENRETTPMKGVH